MVFHVSLDYVFPDPAGDRCSVSGHLSPAVRRLLLRYAVLCLVMFCCSFLRFSLLCAMFRCAVFHCALLCFLFAGGKGGKARGKRKRKHGEGILEKSRAIGCWVA